MNDLPDLADRLDAALGNPPPAPALDLHLVDGRRALRRRRIASAVASVAALALVAGVGTVTLGLQDGTASVAPAAPASRAAIDPQDLPPQQISLPVTMQKADALGRPHLDAGGSLVLPTEDGAFTLYDEVQNPLGLARPDRSLAMNWWNGSGSVTQQRWQLFYVVDGELHTVGGRRTDAMAAEGFDAWLRKTAAQVVAGGGGHPALTSEPGAGIRPQDLVRLDDRDVLVPVDGVRLVEVNSDVDLGDQGDDGEHVVVASVLNRGDSVVFVMARRGLDGSVRYQSWAAAGVATLDAFVNNLEFDISAGVPRQDLP